MRTGDITVSMAGGSFPHVVWNVRPNMEQLGAEWYVGCRNTTLVLVTNYHQSLFVRTAGRLQIDVVSERLGGIAPITTATDLIKWGITTDEQLDDAISHKRKKEKFDYVDNPYFEVVRHSDGSVVFTNHDIMEAVSVAVDTLVMGYAG